jgi:hypothetical protein
MTDAQKDAIVKAAQEWEKVMRDCLSWGERANRHGMEQANLAAAVRAAEQRWTVKHSYPSGKPILCHDGVEQRLDRLDEDALSDLARLLNEDDAKGGAK